MNAPDTSLLLPPLLAGVLVLATHVPLGRQVLARGIIFIDLAVAQLAALGALLTPMLVAHPPAWMAQAGAFTAALAGALALRWADRRWPDLLEALIGTAFVLAATAALLLLSRDPQGAEQVGHMLGGQLLWTTPDDLHLPALLTLLILTVWFGARGYRRPRLFYALFALAVTLSVQLVGVYLVFASLIIPALASRARGGLAGGYTVGLLGYLLGLLASAAFDLPAGPSVVWMLAAAGIAFALLAARGRGADMRR